MNKVAIISGATKGLGRALLESFAARSYRIVGLYRTDDESARNIESECAVKGWLVQLLKVDVSEPACGEILRNLEIIQTAGQLVLINNAGPSFEPRPMHLFAWPDYQQIIFDGLAGMVQCTLALLPLLIKKQNPSTIVNVASSSALSPPKGFAPYAACKAAMQSFTRSVGIEYSPRGIRVFSVSPGFMLTETTSLWHPSLTQAILQNQGGPLELSKVAERIADLVENLEISAKGEDYLIE